MRLNKEQAEFNKRRKSSMVKNFYRLKVSE